MQLDWAIATATRLGSSCAVTRHMICASWCCRLCSATARQRSAAAHNTHRCRATADDDFSGGNGGETEWAENVYTGDGLDGGAAGQQAAGSSGLEEEEDFFEQVHIVVCYAIPVHMLCRDLQTSPPAASSAQLCHLWLCKASNVETKTEKLLLEQDGEWAGSGYDTSSDTEDGFGGVAADGQDAEAESDDEEIDPNDLTPEELEELEYEENRQMFEVCCLNSEAKLVV